MRARALPLLAPLLAGGLAAGVAAGVVLAQGNGSAPPQQPLQPQHEPHQHHQHDPSPHSQKSPHGHHGHSVGPAGATYDLRWIDAMVQHHTGALRMSELVFHAGAPGVGALARGIWDEQAREIRAMGLWRRAWYPEAPPAPQALRPGGNPDRLDGLQPMTAEQIAAMRMMTTLPGRSERITWFLEGMLHHHGGALEMAHDALRNSRNPTLRRLARQIIVAQRGEILQLRRMLARDGLRKPDYHRYDALFRL